MFHYFAINNTRNVRLCHNIILHSATMNRTEEEEEKNRKKIAEWRFKAAKCLAKKKVSFADFKFQIGITIHTQQRNKNEELLWNYERKKTITRWSVFFWQFFFVMATTTTSTTHSHVHINTTHMCGWCSSTYDMRECLACKYNLYGGLNIEQ